MMFVGLFGMLCKEMSDLHWCSCTILWDLSSVSWYNVE